MNNKLFVGNLPWSVDDQALADLFAKYGEVVSARVVRDRMTDRSRGFGFVEFTDEASAQGAVEALNETEVEGRAITVSIAKPKTDE
ncbi:RNA-binding protein [Candidatus Uhrbacteria bacterium CG_4_9_14_0_2_um_filter_41_50]|uniref:RNA-binding protein n=1 Tax=Candidatus Uhrbacteria bacterium CG_4_9_14_0_2_um_filter_41_50 TaxID=1975031 RepID=A0A2M8ENA0_9BACT|nr:MAG: RNA-binding protein [Candidatus Uhrbacteria bacterium CG_4_10_14_3_um_filter_41_21]PIZ54265.1 MAG: RNA-binding protein [Candidatus Uhrbacteria bacterium CG_4_10_14_0_2_um_filter_41_21]PJB84782.1 MAG: RNA-binding protein [Candidatus Uhrbacteria bacterium CG_4_9_14_0_8_um_filter_41_16]PJC24223.1 MAG: RNA-binding protein [Candidatus Uhrbacteria bacterium CG_4_9_14_0_2_um_filter_41_50]PJE74657.1 MAG: RNA-binding protein [Candidatus Uhrbacteria bacterium CG10_big_fil_rev_8_21_14_0_10_41_26]